MNTTEAVRPSSSAASSFGDQLAEILVLIGTVFVAGPPVLVLAAGAVLLALMLVGPFVLVVTLIVALVAATAVFALAAGVLATPYLLVRHLRGHSLHHATTDAEPLLAAVQSPRVPRLSSNRQMADAHAPRLAAGMARGR